MNLYFDEIDWQAGGRKIEIIREDDEANPQIGLQKLRKFVDSDRVDFICGPQASNVAMAMIGYMRQTGAFWLCTAAGVTALTWERMPYLFRSSTSVWQQCNPIAAWMYDNIAKEVVICASDFQGGRDVARDFHAGFTAKGGKILKEIFPPLNNNDFSAYLADIKSIAPPATFNFFAGSDAARFVKQYDEYGLKKSIKLCGFSALIDNDTLPAQGTSAIGGYTSNMYSDTLDNPENKKFVEAYRKKYNNDYPSFYAEYGYVAAQLIARTLNEVGGDTSDKNKLAAAMTALKFNAPRGLFRFDPVTHNVIQNIYIREAVQLPDRIANKVIATIPDVVDPGVKSG